MNAAAQMNGALTMTAPNTTIAATVADAPLAHLSQYPSAPKAPTSITEVARMRAASVST